MAAPSSSPHADAQTHAHPATTPATGRPDVVAIVNARAGAGHADELAEHIRATFATHGLQADVKLAASGEDILSAAAQAVKDRVGIIAAGGGDGSMNAVASVLLASPDCTSAMGVLPLGTLNHFAKDLNIPLELDDAIANIATGRRLRVDTGEVNGVPFINNSSLGLYPDIVRDREKQQSRLGRGKWLAFCWAAMGALRRYPFLNVRLKIEGEGSVRRTPFVFIGNNSYLMTGLNIGKRARLTEGHLSLYVCHRTGRFGLLRLALHALFGRLEEAHDFDVLTASDIKIDTRKKRLRVATDGEVTVMQTPLEYRIRPASLEVIIPLSTAEAADKKGGD